MSGYDYVVVWMGVYEVNHPVESCLIGVKFKINNEKVIRAI
jgi:hypothetical protein